MEPFLCLLNRLSKSKKALISFHQNEFNFSSKNKPEHGQHFDWEMPKVIYCYSGIVHKVLMDFDLFQKHAIVAVAV